MAIIILKNAVVSIDPLQVENAEASGNKSKAAELKKQRYAGLVAELHAQQKALKRNPGRKVCVKEVTEADVARIISKWTGAASLNL